MAYRVQFCDRYREAKTSLEYYDHKIAKFAPEELN
jgi:hypothetical protein